MNKELEQRILDRLRKVIDPETGADVVRMRLVEDLEVDDDGVVRYTFRPSSPLCPIAVTLALWIKQAIDSVPGVNGQAIKVEGYINSDGLSGMLERV